MTNFTCVLVSVNPLLLDLLLGFTTPSIFSGSASSLDDEDDDDDDEVEVEEDDDDCQ
jgi:hypothetical protein